MVTTYIETQNVGAVVASFQERFPGVNPPCTKTVLRNHRKYLANGTSLNLNKGNSGRRRTQRTEANIAAVRLSVTENPTQSTRRRALADISRSSFQRIIKHDLHFHPYHMLVRQALSEQDKQRRVTFCQWFQAQPQNFLQNITIGDEACFTLCGQVNSRNVICYAPKGDPPLDFVFEKRDVRNKLTVWLGIVGNGQIVGPFFFEGNVDGENYLNMINNDVAPVLDDIDVRDANGHYVRLWWFQDGAPAHRRIIVRDRLQELFGGRVVGLGHPREWPPRSPDLTPLDFFMWGYLKSKVFLPPPATLDELRERIVYQVDRLRHEDNGMVVRSVEDMQRRVERCALLEGEQVEGRNANLHVVP